MRYCAFLWLFSRKKKGFAGQTRLRSPKVVENERCLQFSKTATCGATEINLSNYQPRHMAGHATKN